MDHFVWHLGIEKKLTSAQKKCKKMKKHFMFALVFFTCSVIIQTTLTLSRFYHFINNIRSAEKALLDIFAVSLSCYFFLPDANIHFIFCFLLRRWQFITECKINVKARKYQFKDKTHASVILL